MVDGACASCGYDVRGLDGARCPECGWVVGRVPRRAGQAAWWLGTVGMVVLYGLGAIALAMSLAGSIGDGALALLLAVDAPFRVRRWLGRRRAFGLLPNHVKQQMVAGWWLAAAVVAVLVIAPVVRR